MSQSEERESGENLKQTTQRATSPSDSMPEAVVAGHICLDVIPTLAGSAGSTARATWFLPGQTIEAGPVIFATGGAVSNTGLALHKLGISTQLMGKFGADLIGQAILQIVASHGPWLAEGMVIADGE